MKSAATLFTFFLLSIVSGLAQFGRISENQLEALQNDTVIVPLSGKEEFDTALKSAMCEEWTISPVKFVEERVLRMEAADDKDIILFGYFKGIFESEQGTIDNVPFIGLVHGFQPSGKYSMNKEISVYQPFPADGVSPEYVEAYLTLNVRMLHNYLMQLKKNEVSGLGGLIDQIKSRYADIRDKEILICDKDWYTKEKDITKEFDFNYRIVSRSEWSEAIMNGTNGLIYYLVPSVKFAYHFLIDPDDGTVYYYAYGMDGKRNYGRGQSMMFRTLGEKF